MLQGWFVLLIAFLYLSVLFAIAYFGDKRADQKRSLIANPYIFSLSIAVYCTSWTFYGSVGRAASSGIGFLPIYLGPTLVFVLWWFVLRKIIRISKANRITSIADFISSRFGKSTRLSVLVTVIAAAPLTACNTRNTSRTSNCGASAAPRLEAAKTLNAATSRRWGASRSASMPNTRLPKPTSKKPRLTSTGRSNQPNSSREGAREGR